MTFASPLHLLVLLVVPAVLALAIAVRRRPGRNAVTFTNVELLGALVEPRRSWRRWVPVALLLLALIAAAVATAQPSAKLTVPVDNATVVLLVAVSGSMEADDVEPTRLDAAAAAMRTFIDRLPRSANVGLVQFDTEPEVLSAPTTDHEFVRESVGYLVPQAGTAIGDGLAEAVKITQSSLAERGVVRRPGQPVPAVIVLLSDGKQNQGMLEPLTAAARARDAGIRVDTIALGTPDGALIVLGERDPVPPDPAMMKAIARATGGRTFVAHDTRKLESIYSSLSRSVGHRSERREISSWFAAGAALLLLGAVGLGRAWGSALQ
jgi:Ca-activated chloride channel family protein